MRQKIRWRDYRNARAAMRQVQSKIPGLKTLLRHGVARRIGHGRYELRIR